MLSYIDIAFRGEPARNNFRRFVLFCWLQFGFTIEHPVLQRVKRITNVNSRKVSTGGRNVLAYNSETPGVLGITKLILIRIYFHSRINETLPVVNFLEFWFRDVSNHNLIPECASIFSYMIISSSFETCLLILFMKLQQ